MFKPYIMRINGVEVPVELSEVDTVPAPPKNQYGVLSIKDGKIYEGDKRFKSFSTNIVGYAVTNSSKEDLANFLDYLNSIGCRIVRVLHIGGYQPTYNEVEAAWDKMDIFMDLLKEREMYMWYSIQHRQRLLQGDGPGNIRLWDELWGTRPAGIFKGEINDLFFWDDTLLQMLKNHASKLLDRYAKNPALAVLTMANEKTALLSKSYYVGGGLPANPTEYQRVWFEKWNKFNSIYQTAGKKQDINKFLSWVENGVYDELINHVKAAGYKGLVNTTSFFGDRHLSSLMSMTLGDIIDFHIYPENDTTPDPFNAGNFRTLNSIAASIHLKNKALTCTEWASVYQNGALKLQKSGTWLSAPKTVSQWARQQDMDILTQYAAHSNVLSVDAKISVYDSMKDSGFAYSFESAVEDFNKNSESYDEIIIPISQDEIYGYGSGTSFTVTVPGTQQSIIDAVNSGKRIYVNIV